MNRPTMVLITHLQTVPEKSPPSSARAVPAAQAPLGEADALRASLQVLAGSPLSERPLTGLHSVILAPLRRRRGSVECLSFR